MAAKLKKQQIIEYREAFDMFDLDGGGTISNEELSSVFKSLGQNPTQEELEDMLPNDQEMDFQQFLVLMSSKIQTTLSPDEVNEAFKVFDTDDDGLLDVKDLRGILMNKCEAEVITHEEVEALLVRMQTIAGRRVEIIDDVVVPVDGADGGGADDDGEAGPSSYAVDEEDEDDGDRHDGDHGGGSGGGLGSANGGGANGGGGGGGFRYNVDDNLFVDFKKLVKYMMRVSGAQS